MLRLSIATLTGLFSSFAAAHPGHDHSHWLSDPIHLLTLLSVVAITAIGGYALKQKLAKKNEK